MKSFMMINPKKIVLFLIVTVISRVELSQDVMKNLSEHFAKPLEACKKELDLPESVFTEFANFWKEGYQLSDRQTGCAIMCMSTKLDLLDQDFKIHHGNAKEFAMKHGADETMAKQLVDIIHGCGESNPPESDGCLQTLKVAQCFKNKIHDLNWAPSMDLMMGEVLAEV